MHAWQGARPASAGVGAKRHQLAAGRHQSPSRNLITAGAAIRREVDAARGVAAYDMQAFTPMLAILSSQHEVQYSRLFRS